MYSVEQQYRTTYSVENHDDICSRDRLSLSDNIPISDDLTADTVNQSPEDEDAVDNFVTYDIVNFEAKHSAC